MTKHFPPSRRRSAVLCGSVANPWPARPRLAVAALCGLLLLSGCAGGPAQRPAPVSPPPATLPPATQPAPGAGAGTSNELIEAARSARGQGDHQRAEGLLLRALRIDSSNGVVYLELSRLYLDQGRARAASAIAERGMLYCRQVVCDALRQLY